MARGGARGSRGTPPPRELRHRPFHVTRSSPPLPRRGSDARSYAGTRARCRQFLAAATARRSTSASRCGAQSVLSPLGIMAATATMATSGSARKRLLKEEDMTKVEFETSEEVDVTPTFDTMGLREDLLRGIYAYGRWARGAGCERPPGEHGPGRGLGPETGSVAVLKVGDPGWGRARGGSRVTPSLTTRIHPHLCRRVRVLSSRQRALLGPKRAAGSFGHLGVIHSADNCLVSARCAALGTRGLVGNQTGSCP